MDPLKIVLAVDVADDFTSEELADLNGKFMLMLASVTSDRIGRRRASIETTRLDYAHLDFM